MNFGCALDIKRVRYPRRASNPALATIGPAIQWQHSHVAGDKTFCVYLAESEAEIRKHAELSGIPFSKITEVPQIIDPLTANN
ncbi:nickel-binding protein [Antarctobacter jejuensis]|uniref:nickel-binding protein n=1 Tax=Antarctobacter jejuensis TaxID=1439938 RepID=UPI003FD57F61